MSWALLTTWAKGPCTSRPGRAGMLYDIMSRFKFSPVAHRSIVQILCPGVWSLGNVLCNHRHHLFLSYYYDWRSIPDSNRHDQIGSLRCCRYINAPGCCLQADLRPCVHAQALFYSCHLPYFTAKHVFVALNPRRQQWWAPTHSLSLVVEPGGIEPPIPRGEMFKTRGFSRCSVCRRVAAIAFKRSDCCTLPPVLLWKYHLERRGFYAKETA